MSRDPQSAPEPKPGGRADESRAEQVLSQALNVMAGGGKATQLPVDPPAPQGRFSAAQLVLVAAIIGLLVGIGAGLISLAW